MQDNSFTSYSKASAISPLKVAISVRRDVTFQPLDIYRRKQERFGKLKRVDNTVTTFHLVIIFILPNSPRFALHKKINNYKH